MISTPDVLMLLRLLAAHLLADFLLQAKSWIHQKDVRSRQLYYHIAVVGIVTYLFLGSWAQPALPIFIMVTHFFIDWWKSTQKETTAIFLIDQFAHLLMILIGWNFFASTGSPLGNAAVDLLNNTTFWLIASSYFIVTRPFGFLIAKITSRWQQELTEGDDIQLSGLQKAGMWIGCTERLLILTFILINQYSAIGFLIAAKSIFRFNGNIGGNQKRKEAEYILVGTLLSFGLTIALGILINYVLANLR